jgi:hypothetical protein
MGHTRMLLAVAGMDSAAIRQRTDVLAGTDWTTLSAVDRAAFAFAGRQARVPWEITTADTEQLVTWLGQERALDIVWWTSRCNFMTRVADALQLPLETENVFADPPASRADKTTEPEP